MICPRCSSTMAREVAKFMRTGEDKYVVHIFKCSHCGIKHQFKENIVDQPYRNGMLCDGCNQPLDPLSRCKNPDCSECYFL